MTKAQKVAQIRAATGLSWLAARSFLEEKPAVLCERIIRAKQEQLDSTLHDPIEDDPRFASQIAAAKRLAEGEFQATFPHHSGLLRGKGRFLWGQMKAILKTQHGIEWFTPVEMNPGVGID